MPGRIRQIQRSRVWYVQYSVVDYWWLTVREMQERRCIWDQVPERELSRVWRREGPSKGRGPRDPWERGGWDGPGMAWEVRCWRGRGKEVERFLSEARAGDGTGMEFEI